MDLRDKVNSAVEKYLEELRVSAGSLRGWGFDVDSEIPDCATVSYSSIRITSKPRKDKHYGEGSLSIDFQLEIEEPFEWVSVILERDKIND